MKICAIAYLSAALFACACSTGPTAAPASAPASPAVVTQAPTAQAGTARSDHHIYVTSEGLPDRCYSKLGPVDVMEAYADSVIDPDHSQAAARLRQAAMEKYPGQVDAIINLRTAQNDVGTMVEVSGDAVHLNQHETMKCIARTAGQVRDAAAPIAAGGILGTLAGAVAGSFAGSTGIGAAGGAATGVSAGAGYATYEHVKKTRAEEAAIENEIRKQQAEIAQLREQIAVLGRQQCNQQELSDTTCAKRQQDLEQVSTEAASLSAATSRTTASEAKASAFQVRNGLQANQETIRRLQAEVFKLQQETNQQ